MGYASPKTPQPSFVVKGTEMHYEPKKNQSHVKGDAHAVRTLPPSTKGQNTLKGDKAEANLDSGRYSVTAHSKSDKVQAVLMPNRLQD